MANPTEGDLRVAPERIWIHPIALKTRSSVTIYDEKWREPSDIEYVRADVAASALAAEREKAAKIAKAYYHGLARPDGPEVKAGIAIAAAIEAGDKE